MGCRIFLKAANSEWKGKGNFPENNILTDISRISRISWNVKKALQCGAFQYK